MTRVRVALVAAVLAAVASAFEAAASMSQRAAPSGGPAADAQDPWEIPQAASERQNPLPASPEALGVGRALWRIHCETCHGTQGRGDGPNARLHERRKNHAPRNLTKPNVQENLTDGDILWRITRGIIEGDNVIMPAYEDKVPSETERWLLVLYVRELGRRGRVPEFPAAAP